MKKLLLTSCLVLLCASSIKSEEKQADWKENATKYSKIAAKGAFLDLCIYNLYRISKINLRNLPNKLAFDSRNRNIIITSIAGCVAAKSLYDDLTK